VLRYATLRIVLAKAAFEDLEIDHVDIETAFLNPPIYEEIYMTPTRFLERVFPELKHKDAYIRLRKALYGLKQAPREWFQMVKEAFDVFGLRAADSDPNLFIGNRVFVLLFVDDMLIVGKRDDVDKMKKRILKEWKGKDLGPVDCFVGFEITRNRRNRTLTITQSTFIRKLLERTKMTNANSTSLPIPAGTVLKSVDEDDESLLEGDEITVYRQIVGSVLYLSNNTRPDTSYAVGQLARFMSKPAAIHLQMCKQLLRYLAGMIEVGITYSSRRNELPLSYCIYTDSTWGTEEDRVSFQGIVVIRYGGAVSWMSQRQKSTACSSMDAEVIAGHEGAKEAAWMEKVTNDLGERGPEPYIPTLYCDNLGATQLIKDTKFYARAKHIEIRYFYIRNDMVRRNRLRIEQIPSKDQVADMLTKQLPAEKHWRHAQSMGLNKPPDKAKLTIEDDFKDDLDIYDA
jgi:hypothetical protein